MTGAAETTIAVLAALAAACSFGVGVALQHRQAQFAPAAGRAPLRLVARLARRRLWLAGLALAAGAYGLQALALAFGPLTLVAPVVATDLLFALPFAARWSRRPMRLVDWAGCALVGGGITAFLVASPPGLGHSDASARDWALAFTAVALVSAAAITAAMFSRGAARPALLAVATGTVFGLTAAVTLSLTRLLRRESLDSVLWHWQPWAVAVLGAAGLLLSMTAFQAGPLSASLPVMDTVEPVSAVLIGTVVFGERLAAAPAGLALQVAAAAAALAGIVLLGRSSVAARACPQAAEEHGRAGHGPGGRPPQLPGIASSATAQEAGIVMMTNPDPGHAWGASGWCQREHR
jgi:drug/metabolite transporter (DMT)-like permease